MSVTTNFTVNFTSVRRLDVWRRFSDGTQGRVGTLAQNRQGVFFQYDAEYLQRCPSLSPFQLEFSAALQVAPERPHQGLHGVFADSVPDGWGLLLMDRVFRQAGVLPTQITALDRLAYVADSGMGALSYAPASALSPGRDEGDLRVGEIGLQAQALFDGKQINEEQMDTQPFDQHIREVLAALVSAGSSGGARPKIQLYFDLDNSQYCGTRPRPGRQAWLVKFTSAQLALGHEEGLCEAAYLTLAKQAGIDVPHWQLLDAPQQSGASRWLALRRFDTVQPAGQVQEGRLHLHSVCGLLDADFRVPSLDYEDLIKASSLLCKSPAAGQQQFRRAVFNLLALNQDDHSKNWAFLQADDGQWSPAPFYDVTFSPSPYLEHATAFAGHGKRPPLQAMQRLAAHANFASWGQAQAVIQEVAEAMSQFAAVARQLGVSPVTTRLISQQLEQTYQDNKGLLGG